MGRLLISTAMTVDGVIEVTDWYVPGGEHSAAAFAVYDGVDAMLMSRKDV